MKRRMISVFLILLGIGIILYPRINEYYNNHKQDKMLEEWDNIMIDMDNDDELADSDEEIKEAKKELKRKEGDLEGVLKIKKIDLKLPILTGVSHENMKASVASFENSAGPGEIGNYAISGHRNLTYGRNFNRLDEVDVGDELEVETESDIYVYEVKEKLYVEPNETWVLNGNDKDKEITLVTCHPIGVASHRLIIKGDLIE